MCSPLFTVVHCSFTHCQLSPTQSTDFLQRTPRHVGLWSTLTTVRGHLYGTLSDFTRVCVNMPHTTPLIKSYSSIYRFSLFIVDFLLFGFFIFHFLLFVCRRFVFFADFAILRLCDCAISFDFSISRFRDFGADNEVISPMVQRLNCMARTRASGGSFSNAGTLATSDPTKRQRQTIL
mgnify:FL=1